MGHYYLLSISFSFLHISHEQPRQKHFEQTLNELEVVVKERHDTQCDPDLKNSQGKQKLVLKEIGSLRNPGKIGLFD